MKRLLLLIATAFLLQGCTGFLEPVAPFDICRDRVRSCWIRLPVGAGPERRALGTELQHWLQQITGIEIPGAIGLTSVTSGNSIHLGTATDFPAEARAMRLRELGPEGFVVRSERGQLWLLANSELGLQHAAYAFLEYIGCRWYFPDPVWTVVPKHPSLAVTVNLRATPAFGYRRIWYGWGARTKKLADDYNAWMKRNRQLGAFQTDCGHAWERYVPAREFEKHPDWFGLVKGERKPMQLCTSNPEAERRVVEGVLARFRKEPQANMVSVDPNDGGGYCECERCAALGSVSDRAFLLASHVAQAVRKEFPDKWVGLYAYAFHCEPPRTRFAPGVYVQVTTGFRYTKLSFDEQVTAFRKLGAKLGVYDYFSVYPWDWDMPGKAKGSRVSELAESIRHYRDLGLSTYDAESSCNWGPNGLGYWVASKLMWEPDLDAAALVGDFCERAFGKAAGPMRRLYERWASGERFAARGLKLALLDLKEAYEESAPPGRKQVSASETRTPSTEGDAGVCARLDRVAMYLHWLRLSLDYDRAVRDAQPDGIKQSAKELIVFSRRLLDTGLIHAYPLLESEWFKHRFGALLKLKDFDPKEAEAWKKERTDIPSAEETAQLFASGLKRFETLTAVEIERKPWSDKLVPVAERLPQAVKAWGEVPRSPLCVESGIHHFLGKEGERLSLTFTPFDAGHTVDGHWVLRRVGDVKPVAEGDIKAEKGKPAAMEAMLPADGVYALDPGTGYWKTAELGFAPRPLSVWAGRADEPGRPKGKEFRLWLPRLDQPLYFYVPRDVESFVLAFPSVGQAKTQLVLRAPGGKVLLEDKDVRSGDQVSVVVPPEHRGAVWSLSLASLRCVVELCGVPPYLARHPSELLVPNEVLGGTR
ncbi:MAG: DUF4838 domain-containing protein [Planctomycetes bacterium]|nr:DUF4838 domain-containing protein [Planctomycetota bacterium]